MHSTNTIAFFDFDGTITNKDSAWAFLLFTKGKLRLLLGLIWLSPVLLLNRLGLMKAQKAKEKVMSHFFKGQSKDELFRFGAEFCSTLESFHRNPAMDKLAWHKDAGHQIVVVSASFECWLKTWCDKQKVELICTRLNYENGKFSGRLDGPNCNGPEKATQIKQRYNLKSFDTIYAYGDTEGDRAMLELATEPHFKPFRT